MNKSTITIEINLNEEKHPQSIHWTSSDDKEGSKGHESKAMAVAFFDKEYKDTFKIDLWTKDMQVAEMDRFVFHTMRGLADSYFKATKNAQLANDMQRFIQYFGEQTEILEKES